MEIEANNNGIIDNHPSATIEKGFVTLPYTEEDFKEFIGGLLGRGQEIEKNLHGPFEITMNHLTNIHTILNQRITQQNRANLISFSAKIFFTDESTVTLHSFEELQTYNEIRPAICRAIHLSWGYLIQFEDKKIPEKQQINIFINTILDERSKFKSNIVRHLSSDDIIRISISHTARTWAVDIESLLVNYFKNVIEKKDKVKETIAKHSGKISFIAALCFFIGIIYISIATAEQFSSIILADVNTHLSSPDLSTDERLNYISNFIAAGEWNQFTQKLVFFIITGSVLSIILAFVLEEVISSFTTGASYITINEATKKYKQEILKKSNRDWWKLVGTLIIGIVSGVLGNYIFTYLIAIGS